MRTICEKCERPIKGEILQWQDGGRKWTRLCWPCKRPMIVATIPDALRRLKAELESPAAREAFNRVFSSSIQERS